MAVTFAKECTDVGLGQGNGYGALYQKRQPSFFLGSSLKRSGGMASLASPCWTIVPDAYFCPPDYSFRGISKLGELTEEGCVALTDGYGSCHWVTPAEDVSQQASLNKTEWRILSDGKSASEIKICKSDLPLCIYCHNASDPMQSWVFTVDPNQDLHAGLFQALASNGRNHL
jgi:hypothetical protein